METIASIPLIGGFVSTVLPFVVVLGIVVFVHEFGHYIVARWCGIRSEVFSIGFGPVLWSRRDRQGTLWQVAALPLGGYVRFVGDSDGSSRADHEALDRLSAAERRSSFHGASVGRRMLTVLAGPVFNFLLTIVVFAGHRHLAGRADRAADDRRDRGAARGRAAAAAGGRAARRRRAAGGGLRGPLHGRAGDAGGGADAGPGRARRRGGRPDGALRAAAAGAGRRAAVAGERGRAAARRRDPVGGRAGARLVRRAARGGARRRRADDPARGLAGRRTASPSTSRRWSATPTTARAASSGG